MSWSTGQKVRLRRPQPDVDLGFGTITGAFDTYVSSSGSLKAHRQGTFFDVSWDNGSKGSYLAEDLVEKTGLDVMLEMME